MLCSSSFVLLKKLTWLEKRKVQCPYFFPDQLEELTGHARCLLLGKGTFDLPTAKGARNRPTNPAAILSQIQSIIGSVFGGGTDSKLCFFYSIWLSPTFLILPTILWYSHKSPFLPWCAWHLSYR